MHAYLFEHQNALEDAELQRYALSFSLDADRFERDLRSAETGNRVDRDLASGAHNGVEGTPTFYANGVRRDGPYDLESLHSAIVAAPRTPPLVEQRRRTSTGG
jgi:formate-nitrite transporter family protein